MILNLKIRMNTSVENPAVPALHSVSPELMVRKNFVHQNPE